MQIPVNHAGCQKQHQFKQGMIHHMEKSAPHRKHVTLSQQSLHADPYHNKSDLGDRRAGQRPLKIYGKQRKYRADHHRRHAKRQNDRLPYSIMRKYLTAYHKHTENPGFRQNTGQKRAGRRRCHRMCLRQPDMQRKHTCFRPKAKQQAGSRGIHIFPSARLIQRPDLKRPRLMVQKKQTHQHHKTARHRHCQIDGRRPQRLPSLILRHPDIRSKRHRFKKYKRRVKIRRQKDRFRRPQSDQLKQIIPVSVPIMLEIFHGKQRCHHPHKSGNTDIDRPKTVHRKGKSHTADI